MDVNNRITRRVLDGVNDALAGITGQRALVILAVGLVIVVVAGAIFVLQTPPQSSQPKGILPSGALELIPKLTGDGWNPPDSAPVRDQSMVRMSWALDRPLGPGEEYYVFVWCRSSGAAKSWDFWTTESSLNLAAAPAMSCDQDKYYWAVGIQRVEVVRANGTKEGPLTLPLGSTRYFYWQPKFPIGS